jgi:hypothetical protein
MSSNKRKNPSIITNISLNISKIESNRFMNVNVRKALAFSVIALLVFALKISISTLGYNNDMEIWKHVSKAMYEGFLKGRVIYTYTQFYNHGPIRSYALYFLAAILNKLSLPDMFSFHMAIVFFLAISDTLIALLLWKLFGKVPAIIFLLNPVSFLITGYHSQVGTIPIMLGLLSWFILLKAKKMWDIHNPKYKKLLLISALILGLSLGIKHILFFFPIYIFFMHRRYKIFRLSDIVVYIGIVYFIFFGLFGIEILRDSYHPMATTYRNIKMFVFDYRSGGLYGTSGFSQLIKLFIPAYYIEKYFSWVPFFSSYSFFFVSFLISYGILAINKVKDLKLIFPLYLLAMFCFSPSLANQYLVVPLIAMSIYYKNLLAFGSFILSYTHLASGPSANISGLVKYPMELMVGKARVPFFPWNIFIYLKDTYSQTWALMLAAVILFQMYANSINTKVKNLVRAYF